jgi:DNA repair exonuclease SbcCD ATPase subunit
MHTDDLIENKGTAKNMPVALTLEHVSPVTRLLEKRKQMLEVQKSLDAQKDEYQRKEELFKRREENLRKKDLELQEALVLFNKFLKENEHKRRRADHRANEEIKKRHKWEKEIAVKKQNLEQLKIKCRKLKQQHKKNEKYQFFLNKVLEQHGNHFDEIPSIINRHATLEEAFRDLIAKQKESTTKSETLRQEFQETKKRQYNHILELNNTIATRSKDLEDKAKEAAAIEENIVEEENKQSERKTETTKIIMSVDNLYNRCKKVVNSVIKHAAHRLSAKEKEMMDPMMVKQLETCGKLEVIKDYLQDFDKMVKEIKNENRMMMNPGQTTGAGMIPGNRTHANTLGSKLE